MAADIQLNDDEALVLFDFLARHLDGEDRGKLESLFVHPAEQMVFAGLLTDLERQLAEPFRQDYPDFLQQARHRLAVNYEEA